MPLSALEMNIGGSEWAIIIMLGLILLFGSKKLPEISRTFGRMLGEYEKSKQLLRKEIEEATKTIGTTNYNIGPKITGPIASERQKLEIIANSMGIDHMGKTDEQLRSMILKRMYE